MDDYEREERKQAAIRLLSNYSQFALACIGQGVPPHKMRLHLMKEISGIPTSLDDYKPRAAKVSAPTTTPVPKGEGTSSSEFLTELCGRDCL